MPKIKFLSCKVNTNLGTNFYVWLLLITLGLLFREAHGHTVFICLFQLLKHKSDVNFVNEHGNTALHYACFWNYPAIAEDLVIHAVVPLNIKYFIESLQSY